MDEFRLNTGNAFADAMIERRLGASPEFWALVDYLVCDLLFCFPFLVGCGMLLFG